MALLIKTIVPKESIWFSKKKIIVGNDGLPLYTLPRIPITHLPVEDIVTHRACAALCWRIAPQVGELLVDPLQCHRGKVEKAQVI